MFIISVIAAVAAASTIYTVENKIDRGICNKVAEKRQAKAEAEAAPQQAAPVPVQPVATAPAAPVQQAPAQPVQPVAAAPAPTQPVQQVYVNPAPAPAPAQQQAAPVIDVVATPVEQPKAEPFWKRGDKVSISDTAKAIVGEIPQQSRVGRINKVNDDGTVVVGISLGGKAGSRAVTVSEYDVFPAE
jgi:hypothetical protein